MLNNFFSRLLEEIDTESLYFWQDGATAHTADMSMTTLRNDYEASLISRSRSIDYNFFYVDI